MRGSGRTAGQVRGDEWQRHFRRGDGEIQSIVRSDRQKRERSTHLEGQREHSPSVLLSFFYLSLPAIDG